MNRSVSLITESEQVSRWITDRTGSIQQCMDGFAFITGLELWCISFSAEGRQTELEEGGWPVGGVLVAWQIVTAPVNPISAQGWELRNPDTQGVELQLVSPHLPIPPHSLTGRDKAPPPFGGAGGKS